MDFVIVQVTIPAAGKDFEVRIPASMNTLTAANLTAKAVSGKLSDGAYFASRNSFFAWKENGKILRYNKSMEQEHVQNGSQLLLI